MKFACHCGATIVDQTDGLPNKGRWIADQDWFHLLDAIDAAIETSGPHANQKEAACMNIRHRLCTMSRSAWQCHVCGRIYVEDRDRGLRPFTPGEGASPDLFRGLGSADPTA